MSRADKAALAKGADAIKKTKAVAVVKLAKSTRSIEDILREHTTMAAGNVGVTLSDDIPLEEALRVLDYWTNFHEHVGFIIGDIINYGECRWGEKYTAAMEQTGRAKPTLKTYASVALRIPVEHRQPALGFEHHREILKLGDRSDGATFVPALREAAEQAEKGQAPTVKELRDTVKQATKLAAPNEQADATDLDDIAEELQPRKRHKSQKQIEKEQQRINEQAQKAEKQANDQLATIIKKLKHKVRAAWPQFPGHLATHGKALSELAERLQLNTPTQ